MKKITILFILLVSGIINSNAQIDNLSNLSAEWMRSGVRNAATDAADIVVYNPAGITSMKNGIHINFSNQSLFRNPNHTYDLGMGEGQKEYEQSSPDLFLPNLYIAYKKNNWALYSGVFFSGGGATIDYKQGSITTDLIGLGTLGAAQGAYTSIKDPFIKASSMYKTTTLGGSYAVKRGISFSAAIRYLSAANTSELGMTLASSPYEFPDAPMSLKTKDNASGMSGVFGVSLTALDKVSISARYETKVKLNFKTEQDHDDFGLTTDGDLNRRDLPAVLALGIGFDVTSKFKVMADYNYYFQEDADWGKSSVATNEVPLSLLAGNSTIIAFGFQYKIKSKITVSSGVGFTKMDFQDKAGYYANLGTFEVVHSDNTNIKLGFAYKPIKNITFNLGYMHVFYPSDQQIKVVNAQPLDVTINANNSINAVALGVNLSF